MDTRPAAPEDFPTILALNRELEHFLSPLTPQRLQWLHDAAALHLVALEAGRVAAFVLALPDGTDYDSVNYRWFADRYPRFLYVDRVVVAVEAHGHGLGRTLYDAVFEHAALAGFPVVTCEYDIDPPNPGSERFHRRFGFAEVGRQRAGGGKKQVSLQVAPVGHR
jgi:predicted GNAT superfamily acetyltransferase